MEKRKRSATLMSGGLESNVGDRGQLHATTGAAEQGKNGKRDT